MHFLPLKLENQIFHDQANIEIKNDIMQMSVSLYNKHDKRELQSNTTRKSNIMSSTFDRSAFRLEHQVLRIEDLVVWIPRDEYRFSDEEVSHICSKYPNVWVSNKHADMDRKCNIKVQENLPKSIFQAVTKQI